MNSPKFRVPSAWGLCFAGNEEHYCAAIDAAMDASHGFMGIFIYLEIGLGYGDTMRAAQDYMLQSGRPFRCFGVDIVTCNGQAALAENYPAKDTIICLDGAKTFLERAANGPNPRVADFVFIDGCHGAECVSSDFLGVEKIVHPGSIVVFHDTDHGCQDIHLQPHCGTGIRAREAVEKLGLLDDSRPGWKKLEETSGNKDRGGHGCLFVQRCA